MSNRYWANNLIGGSAGSLDIIDPSDTDGSATALVVGDICDVVQETMISIYIARNSSGAVESLPEVILPDLNTGNWWWELIERIPRDEGVVTALLYGNTPGVF